MIDWRAVAERVFKEESARILAGLIRLCRSFDWAEEAMQDAFASGARRMAGERRAQQSWRLDHDGRQRRIVDRARRETHARNIRRPSRRTSSSAAREHDDQERTSRCRRIPTIGCG